MHLQRFTLPNYCNSGSVASAVAGKDIMLCVYDSNDTLLAIAGQQSLTINRSADTIEVNSKSDNDSGWKSYVAGMKGWSIELGGIYVPSESSMEALNTAFTDSDTVCVVVKNTKTNTYLFGGTAYITDFPIEAPYDDSMTYSISLSGVGELQDISSIYANPSQFEVTIPASGSVTKTADIIANKGTVTAACSTSGVTPTISNGVLSIAIASTASSGLARVILTDTYTGGSDTYEVRVILNATTV